MKASTSVVLPMPASAETTHQPGLAALRALELMQQRVHLLVAADDARGSARRRGATVTDDERRRNRGVVREPEAVQDLARAWPQPRILLQRLEDELVERARHIGIEERRRLGRLPHQRVQRAELRGGHERMTARDQLVEQHAEREDVRLGGDRFAARLLGRHVAHGADDQAGSVRVPRSVEPAVLVADAGARARSRAA